jgi:hypothetical protein
VVTDPARDARNALAAPLITAFVASGAIMLIELSAGPAHLAPPRHVALHVDQHHRHDDGRHVGRQRDWRLRGRSLRAAPRAGRLFLPRGGRLRTAPASDERLPRRPRRTARARLALAHLPALRRAVLRARGRPGGIAPVVARLALGLAGPPGRTVGLVYASSVAGSIFCTFLTGYYLVLVLGVQRHLPRRHGDRSGTGPALLAASFLTADTAPRAHEARRGCPRHRPRGGPQSSRSSSRTSRSWPLNLRGAPALARLRQLGLHLDRDHRRVPCGHHAGQCPRRLGSGHRSGGAASWRSISSPLRLPPAAGPLLYRLVARRPSLQNDRARGTRLGHRAPRSSLGAGFFLPCLFIGYISPLIVKRGLDAGRAPGRTVASVYAWGASAGCWAPSPRATGSSTRSAACPVIAAAPCLLAIAGAAYHRGPVGFAALAAARRSRSWPLPRFPSRRAWAWPSSSARWSMAT